MRQEIADEFAGRYLFTDYEQIKALAKEQPGTVKRIRQALSGWIQKINPTSKIAQKIYSDMEAARDLYAKALREVGGAKAEATDEIRHNYVGTNADGIEVYETSPETKALTWKERVKQFENRLVNEYAGRTARFVRNGHVYYAEIDRTNPVKSLYGDFRFSKEGKKAYIKSGADGDLFNLIENAEYDYSSKDKKNHKSKDGFTDYFDYFVKTVQIDGKVYNLNATVKKQYGTSDGYTYTLFLADNKKIKASPAMTAQGGLESAGNASADSISQSTAESQPISENSSDENRHSYEDYDEEGFVRRMRDELEQSPMRERDRGEAISADEYERRRRNAGYDFPDRKKARSCVLF